MRMVYCVDLRAECDIVWLAYNCNTHKWMFKWMKVSLRLDPYN